MKKLFTLVTLSLFMALNALADAKPTNDAFYLVGNMNDWGCPVDEATASHWEYKLTDEDGDGVYTGSFEFPQGDLEFKLFSTIGDWDTADYFGSYQSVYVFNDPTTLTLSSGGFSGNISVSNWMGGTLKLSAVWTQNSYEEWVPEITMEGTNQPERPAFADLYLIGDFNNWSVPTAANANGAIRFDLNEAIITSNNVQLIKAFDACDNIKVAVCRLDSSTGKCLFYHPQYEGAFTLYTYKTANGDSEIPGMNLEGEWSEDNVKEKYTITINDWKGGNINFHASFPYNGNDSMMIRGLDSVPVEWPQNPLYLLTEVDGVKTITPSYSDYWAPVYYTILNGQKVSVLLTTENSLTPAPENCWGIKTSLEEAGVSSPGGDYTLQMVKGGQPLVMEYPYLGRMYTFFRFATSTVYVDMTYINKEIEADKVYICGNVSTGPDGVYNDFTCPSVANQENYDRYWRLDEVEPGIFSKAYYVHEVYNNIPQFRFFTDLLGWTDKASLGAAEPDFYYIPVNLSEGPVEYVIYKGGLSNWGMSDSWGETWTASWVRVVVNTNTGRVRFEKVTSGVDDIETEENGEVTECWYNLQGVKVEKPNQGLYIHVRNGKSAVEMVK